MATVTALRKPKVTIGSLIDEMSAIRETRRELEASSNKLKEQYDGLEQQLIELMDAEGTVKSTGHAASASIGEAMNFSFEPEEGFEKFMAYIAKTKQFHLVQRRVSAPAARELIESKGKVPGLVPFIKRQINLRNL